MSGFRAFTNEKSVVEFQEGARNPNLTREIIKRIPKHPYTQNSLGTYLYFGAFCVGIRP